MPKRNDIRHILLIGSGPIVIGQGCEFDYSGTQACKALRAEGYEITLVNSNPATIMTDPEMAERTYVEPITPEFVERIIARERPDALLPTMGGQTALNTTVALAESGVLDRYGVELIGAKIDAIQMAEDRSLFKVAMASIGLDMPRSGIGRSLDEIREVVARIGFPVILRPSFTLGGTGGSIVRDRAELEEFARWALSLSPTHEVLIDESLIGWKEYELEVMRDSADNAVIICTIENLDPMGVHTGDSITVAPAQTLTDKEYQYLRDAAIACIRKIGVETGGSNVQFAVNPHNGRTVIIEMNPRVSRSSALASKATGFPIAKIAALLAVGFRLDEIRNDITRVTPASFEPTIDYVVTKVPRFTFEKFKGTEPILGPQMKSVGEAMAIGRTFHESLQKALRSMEIDTWGLDPHYRVDARTAAQDPDDVLVAEARTLLREVLKVAHPNRLWHIADAMRAGLSDDEIHALCAFDPWFLAAIRDLVEAEADIAARQDRPLTAPEMRRYKRLGFSDERIGALMLTTADAVRARRRALRIEPVFKRVDTCGAEFEAFTPYLYSTYETEDETNPTHRDKVIILGSGPNRIGQGIEFDYCCVHASMALREAGYETIMVNCNPETVSTDYDTSDRLYFEPLTVEDVLAIVERERPEGVIVQFGGQTPLKLALPLERAGVPIFGTTPDAIDRAEDRERFQSMLSDLRIEHPRNGLVRSIDEAVVAAAEIGYPVLVRPSYVLGGRAMEIVDNEASLRRYMVEAVSVSADRPVLIDQFLEGAHELDVDCIADGERVVIGGVMEHVEEAGIHSGDSACSLPPYSVPMRVVREVERQTEALALELGIVGLMNVQFAVQFEPDDPSLDAIFVLEVNPRASRTVPFVSKAVGVPLAKFAARVMAGESLDELGLREIPSTPYVSVKEAVFPFIKFHGVDTLLGPEMKSTGEVMGIDDDFPAAFAKSQIAASNALPSGGVALLSVDDGHKAAFVSVARDLLALGFELVASPGTAAALDGAGLAVRQIEKRGGDSLVAEIESGRVALVMTTTRGGQRERRSGTVRRAALMYGVPYFTTVSGARAAVAAVRATAAGQLGVRSLQEHHAG